jgi:hypothetical protein
MRIMKRRDLTPEERSESERLSSAWVTYKASHKGATQVWLGAESGLGTQGAVGQYLRGVIPLNLGALLAMCRVIEVDPRAISPRLTSTVEWLVIGGGRAQTNQAGAAPSDSMKLLAETAREMRLLTAHRLGSEDDQLMLDDLVDDILARVLPSTGRNEG